MELLPHRQGKSYRKTSWSIAKWSSLTMARCSDLVKNYWPFRKYVESHVSANKKIF